MVEKLRSHLRQEKGFTLVELLIVIAIIAILVIIALVAINPVQRIHDASDRTAESDVRQVATAFEGCMARNNEDITQCNTQALLTSAVAPPEGAQWVRNWPTGVTISAAGVICKNGGTGHSAQYDLTTGSVAHQNAACT